MQLQPTSSPPFSVIFTHHQHYHAPELFNTSHATLECIHLFIKLIDDAFCPLQMQVFAFCRPIDVSQLDAHLTNQQAVVLIGPVNSNIIVHLGDRKKETMTVILGKKRHPQRKF